MNPNSRLVGGPERVPDEGHRMRAAPERTVAMADERATPALGLGTYGLTGPSCERVVTEALELGYPHVDTAEGYGNEREIGRALAGTERQDVFLTSKVSPDHLEPESLRRACEDSLRRLGSEYLDLYLIHWPNSAVPLERTVEALLDLREDGRILSWGVSNFTPTHLRRAASLELPALNQVEMHPYFRQSGLVRDCHALGVPLTAYSPLARARVMDDAAILEIADARGATPARVVLAWLLGRGHVIIPKASSRAHLEDNLGALGLSLTEAEIERLEERPQAPRLFDFPWAEFDL